MDNWLIKYCRRRFKPNDKVRFFTDTRKGKGKGIVLTPNFSKGEVLDYDPEQKKYVVIDKNKKPMPIHPRNIYLDK